MIAQRLDIPAAELYTCVELQQLELQQLKNLSTEPLEGEC